MYVYIYIYIYIYIYDLHISATFNGIRRHKFSFKVAFSLFRFPELYHNFCRQVHLSSSVMSSLSCYLIFTLNSNHSKCLCNCFTIEATNKSYFIKVNVCF